MSASWPPDFKQYENLSPDQVIKAIITESQNKQAPSCYTHFFEQLATFVEDQGELLKKQKTLNDNNGHSIQIVEANYNTLTILYEEEHGRFLDLQENTIEEKSQYKHQLEQLQQELALEKEKRREENERMKQEDINKQKKQAMVRANLEQELIKTMKETHELRQKLNEAEVKTADLEKTLLEKHSQYQSQNQQQHYQQPQHQPQYQPQQPQPQHQHQHQQQQQQQQQQPQQPQQQQQQPQQSTDRLNGLDAFFAYLGNNNNGYNVVGNPPNYST